MPLAPKILRSPLSLISALAKPLMMAAPGISPAPSRQITPPNHPRKYRSLLGILHLHFLLKDAVTIYIKKLFSIAHYHSVAEDSLSLPFKLNLDRTCTQMDDHKPRIIDDLIAIVGEKAVLQKIDDTKSYLSDWHDRFHGSAHAVVLPESTKYPPSWPTQTNMISL